MDIAAEIAAAELSVGMTAIVPPSPGDKFALSANNHWDYEERSTGSWAIWDRRADRLFGYAAHPDIARRRTFDADHPLHGPEREQPARPAVRFHVL